MELTISKYPQALCMIEYLDQQPKVPQVQLGMPLKGAEMEKEEGLSSNRQPLWQSATKLMIWSGGKVKSMARYL